ncbi:hypothetical protein [Lacinutrix venerupis]|nr:hypothetical protein [Lacinutrix venerupis]
MNRKIFILIFGMLILSSCKKEKQQKELIKETYFQNVSVIESFVRFEKDTIYGDDLYDAISFLENLTNIKCSTSESYDPIIEPTEENISDWKKWYELNKTFLEYSDEKKVYLDKQPN